MGYLRDWMITLNIYSLHHCIDASQRATQPTYDEAAAEAESHQL